MEHSLRKLPPHIGKETGGGGGGGYSDADISLRGSESVWCEVALFAGYMEQKLWRESSARHLTITFLLHSSSRLSIWSQTKSA